MLLNPLAWISANVDACTGALFHEPSVGVASRVFPRFQPGFSAANATEAVSELKVPGQVVPVAAADVTAVEAFVLEEMLATEVDAELVAAAVVT